MIISLWSLITSPSLSGLASSLKQHAPADATLVAWATHWEWAPFYVSAVCIVRSPRGQVCDMALLVPQNETSRPLVDSVSAKPGALRSPQRAVCSMQSAVPNSRIASPCAMSAW